MANQVDRNHLGDVSQSRSSLIPRPHAARKAMQKKQGRSVAVDLDVEFEVVQPHQATGRPPASLVPRALGTTPSMPLAPRFARQRRLRALARKKVSRSRTGMLLPANTRLPSGSTAPNSENTFPSNSSSMSAR